MKLSQTKGCWNENLRLEAIADQRLLELVAALSHFVGLQVVRLRHFQNSGSTATLGPWVNLALYREMSVAAV